MWACAATRAAACRGSRIHPRKPGMRLLRACAYATLTRTICRCSSKRGAAGCGSWTGCPWPASSSYPRHCSAVEVGRTTADLERSARPSPGGGPWDARSHWTPNRSPFEPSRFGPVETSPANEAAARSAPRVAAGRTWPARRRLPPARGRCRSPRRSGALVRAARPAPGWRRTPGRRGRRRRAPGGSRPPDARSTSLFSHASIRSLYGKVLPYRSMHLTSCTHHSFRTARPVPSARPGRLRRTH